MKYVYSLLVLLLALFLAAFIQQNGTAIQLRYFTWSTPHLPVSLYMILCFGAGYALAVFVGLTSGVRFRIRTSAAEREARRLRSELEALKQEELKTIAASQSRPETPEGQEEPTSDTVDVTAAADEPTRNISSDDGLDPRKDQDVTGSGGEEEK